MGIETGHTTGISRHRGAGDLGVCRAQATAVGLSVWFWLAALAVTAGLDARFAFGQEPGDSLMLEPQSASESRMPRRIGVGLTIYYQDQDYEVADLVLNPVLPDVPPPSDIEVSNDIVEANLKLDIWLLPMLNVFGLLGAIDGWTDVVYRIPIGENEVPFTLQIDYNGLLYGGGVVVAYGVDRYFGAVNTTFTGSNLSTSGSTVEAWVVHPRFGAVFGGVGLWVGAMYQEADEQHRGEIFIPTTGTVEYDVLLQQKKTWNFMAGMIASFRRHWEFEASFGAGARKNATMSLAYRP